MTSFPLILSPQKEGFFLTFFKISFGNDLSPNMTKTDKNKDKCVKNLIEFQVASEKKKT